MTDQSHLPPAARKTWVDKALGIALDITVAGMIISAGGVAYSALPGPACRPVQTAGVHIR